VLAGGWGRHSSRKGRGSGTSKLLHRYLPRLHHVSPPLPLPPCSCVSAASRRFWTSTIAPSQPGCACWKLRMPHAAHAAHAACRMPYAAAPPPPCAAAHDVRAALPACLKVIVAASCGASPAPALQFGTAPVCSGECNVGDRVMARAQSSSDVPSDQGDQLGRNVAAGWFRGQLGRNVAAGWFRGQLGRNVAAGWFRGQLGSLSSRWLLDVHACHAVRDDRCMSFSILAQTLTALASRAGRAGKCGEQGAARNSKGLSSCVSGSPSAACMPLLHVLRLTNHTASVTCVRPCHTARLGGFVQVPPVQGARPEPAGLLKQT